MTESIMTEQASVDVPMDQLAAFVAQLSHESRIKLAQAVFAVPVDESMLEECNLEELNIGQLQSGQTPQFICPHVGCEAMFHPDRLYIVALFRREESPANYEWTDIEEGEGILYDYNSTEVPRRAWKRLGQTCPECGNPVALPRKWERQNY